MWTLGSVRRGCSARVLVFGLTCALALGLGANAFAAGANGLAAGANALAANANQVPNLVPGTELLITNLSGTSLVGYGLVDSEGLTLFLSSSAATLQVIVVLPGESPRHFLGEVVDERVYLRSVAGERVDLARALAGVGRTLTLEFADGRTVAVAAGEDEPGETASDAPAVPDVEPASAPETPASEPQRPSVTRPTPPEPPDAATDRPGAPAPPAADDVPGGVPGRGAPGQPGAPVAPAPPGRGQPPSPTPPEPGEPRGPPVVSPPGPPVSPPVEVPADPHDDDHDDEESALEARSEA